MKQVTRREAVTAGALGVAGLYVAGCGSSSSSSQGSSIRTGDAQLGDVERPLPPGAAARRSQKQTQITARPSLESDDSDGYLKIKQTGGQFDIVSTDALWAPKFHTDGLTDSFDINSIPAASQLYPMARTFPFWTVSGGYLAYPNGWSTMQLYYNPAHVSPAPDVMVRCSLDTKYAGKVVAENQPTDLMAMAGLATGAKEPYNMTTAELSKATDFLKARSPTFFKLVSQNSGLRAGARRRVGVDRDREPRHRLPRQGAGGPTVKIATSEGRRLRVHRWRSRSSRPRRTRTAFNPFMNAMAPAELDGPELPRQRAAAVQREGVQVLVDHGYKERADLLFYNQPERALKMTLKGPSGNVQAYIDAFNSVFGA